MIESKLLPRWFSYLAIMGLCASLVTACSNDGKDQSQVVEEKRVSVRVAQAEKGDIQSWVFAEGTARSSSREYLVFQEAGKVAYLNPDLREGSLVEKGTVLARQDQRRIKADLNEAKTQLELAKKTFSRFATLLKQNSASKQEFDEARAKADQAKAALDKLQVKLEESELIAPINGMVAYLNIKEGYYFQPGIVRTDSEEAALNTVPIILIDPSKFEIAVDIPVYDNDRVKIGQTVLIQTRQSQLGVKPSLAQENDDKDDAQLKSRTGQTLPVNLSEHIRGEVYSVNPAVSPSGRSIQVEIRTRDTGMRLKDGMYVTVWIAVESNKNVITAPFDAFFFRDNQPFVFVVDRDSNTAKLQKLTLGLQGFDSREILSGVTPGDLIVTEGRYQLNTGAKLKLLNNPALPPQTKKAGSSNE